MEKQTLLFRQPGVDFCTLFSCQDSETRSFPSYNMNIDNILLDSISEQARRSPRLRQHYDLRDGDADGSQRMLNALEPGTVLPIHRHRDTSETIVILRGRATQLLYDDMGRVVEQVELTPGGPNYGMKVEAGRWHRLVCQESGTVIIECKNGFWSPLAQEDILPESGE